MTQDKKKATGRHMKVTPEFRSEAVRLVMSSGRSAREIASDLGIGHSTLNKWVSAHKDKDLLSGPHDDVTKELARLRKENEILRQERELLKKAAAFFARETTK